jgi:hypothetical protein
LPPKELKKLADQELEKEFRRELALWEKIEKADTPEPFEAYLMQYPNGRYAELAQLQLDKILARLGEKKIEVVSVPENPYSKGTIRLSTAYRMGDRYSYRAVDTLTRLELRSFTLRVTEINDTQVIFNNGSRTIDHLGNPRVYGPEVWGANQIIPNEFAIGKRWNTKFDRKYSDTNYGVMELELRVAERELISVPAGQFNAFRLEAKGYYKPLQYGSVAWNWKLWFAPDQVRQPVALEWFNRTSGGQITNAQRHELTGFTQS